MDGLALTQPAGTKQSGDRMQTEMRVSGRRRRMVAVVEYELEPGTKEVYRHGELEAPATGPTVELLAVRIRGRNVLGCWGQWYRDAIRERVERLHA